MRRAAVLAASLIAVLGVPAFALGVPSAATANSQTYQDATGEDPAGPDITTIAVSNDDAGVVTFQVTIANRPALTPDMVVLVFLDTTEGAGDGDTLGADYALQLVPEGAALFKWDGSEYTADTPQRTLSGSYASGVATFKVAAVELGGAKTLRFLVLAVTGIVEGPQGPDFSNARRDLAPTRIGGLAGLYTYEVDTTLVLRAAGFTTSPARARAGGRFSAALAATRNDTQGLVRAGTVTCRARIGTAAVRAVQSRVRNGVATCVWALPANASGKTIRGTVTLVVDGARLSRAFSARVA
jgi:hypothetical protein